MICEEKIFEQSLIDLGVRKENTSHHKQSTLSRANSLMIDETLATQRSSLRRRQSGSLMATRTSEVEMRQRCALAHARVGATHAAIDLLEPLVKRSMTDEGTLASLGRCHKDLAMNHPFASKERRASLLTSHELYLKCFESNGRSSYFTGVNAATTAMLLDTPASTGGPPSVGGVQCRYLPESVTIARTVAEECNSLCEDELRRKGARVSTTDAFKPSDSGPTIDMAATVEGATAVFSLCILCN